MSCLCNTAQHYTEDENSEEREGFCCIVSGNTGQMEGASEASHAGEERKEKNRQQRTETMANNWKSGGRLTGEDEGESQTGGDNSKERSLRNQKRVATVGDQDTLTEDTESEA